MPAIDTVKILNQITIETDIREIKENLIKLGNRIAKIEDEDNNYIQNSTWQRLRKQQDELYLKLAKLELEFYETKNTICPDKKKEEHIEFCKNYIENNKEKEIGNEINETKLL